MQREWFREVPYIERILLVLEGILDLEVEPLLVTLSIGVNVQI